MLFNLGTLLSPTVPVVSPVGTRAERTSPRSGIACSHETEFWNHGCHVSFFERALIGLLLKGNQRETIGLGVSLLRDKLSVCVCVVKNTWNVDL